MDHKIHSGDAPVPDIADTEVYPDPNIQQRLAWIESRLDDLAVLPGETGKAIRDIRVEVRKLVVELYCTR